MCGRGWVWCSGGGAGGVDGYGVWVVWVGMVFGWVGVGVGGVGVSVGRLVGEDGCVSGVGVCCMHDGEEILESCFSWRHVTLLLLDPVSRERKVSWEIRPWYFSGRPSQPPPA